MEHVKVNDIRCICKELCVYYFQIVVFIRKYYNNNITTLTVSLIGYY